MDELEALRKTGLYQSVELRYSEGLAWKPLFNWCTTAIEKRKDGHIYEASGRTPAEAIKALVLKCQARDARPWPHRMRIR